jgi:hypothetical protein
LRSNIKEALRSTTFPNTFALSAAQIQIDASKSTRPLMNLQQGVLRGPPTTTLNMFNRSTQTFNLPIRQLRGIAGGGGGIVGGGGGGGNVGGVEGGVVGGTLGEGVGGVDGGVVGVGGGVKGGCGA